jgi:hypothetical protein
VKKTLPILSSVLLALLSFPTYGLERVTQGIFVDGQMGWGRINELVKDVPRKDMNGFAYNANIGYRINRFWALEAGYYGFPKDDLAYGVKGRDNQAYAGDIKIIIPYDCGFNLIGKLGITASQHTLSPHSVPEIGSVAQSGHYTRDTMLLGLGVSYSLTNRLDLVLQGTGLTHNSPVPAKIMVSTGLTYTL